MCLATVNQEPVEATEDIIVYKILKYNLQAPFQDFQYELGKIYYTELRKSSVGNFFSSKDRIFYTERFALDDLQFYQEGFHSFSKLQDAIYHGHNYSIVKCVIPKGSLYVENLVGMIASNTIQIVEKVSNES